MVKTNRNTGFPLFRLLVEPAIKKKNAEKVVAIKYLNKQRSITESKEWYEAW